MSMNRMKHEVHGFHHPLTGAERATMLANGWTDDDEPKSDQEGDAPTRPRRKPKAAPDTAPDAAPEAAE